MSLSKEMTDDVRLIERWLPIAALGEESVRERRFSMAGNALPPNNSLHVWWARRPLVASRAAVLASLLPAHADHEKFTHALGILGDPIKARQSIERARKTGIRIPDPYFWPRAFRHNPTEEDRRWIASELGDVQITVLDPTAGGGSIPFEASRLGFNVQSNDLNPVASLIEKASMEWPLRFGRPLKKCFEKLSSRFRSRLEERLAPFFLQRNAPRQYDQTYFWARTVTCPYCDGVVPLSPNWRLAADGTGIRLQPRCESGPGSQGRRCDFVIVYSTENQSIATVSDGDGTCPFQDCGRVINGDEIKRQAQEHLMGEQIFAILGKRSIETSTKTGKRGKDKWERFFRAPLPEDDSMDAINAALAIKLPEWETLDIIPTENIDNISNYDRGHRLYGVEKWIEMFNPRNVLCHGTSVEVFRELLSEDEAAGINEMERAAFVYLSLSIDTMLNYGNKSCRYDIVTERVRSIFDRHGFAFCWSYAEMSPLIAGLGYDWASSKTAKCIEDITTLVRPDVARNNDLFNLVGEEESSPPSINITCKSGAELEHIQDASIDAVVMDPPYYDNVMYAELSDFFYVWLKRTAGNYPPPTFVRVTAPSDQAAF
jgi:putative DNA methylase